MLRTIREATGWNVQSEAQEHLHTQGNDEMMTELTETEFDILEAALFKYGQSLTKNEQSQKKILSATLRKFYQTRDESSYKTVKLVSK